jgi:hypothetical protein
LTKIQDFCGSSECNRGNMALPLITVVTMLGTRLEKFKENAYI